MMMPRRLMLLLVLVVGVAGAFQRPAAAAPTMTRTILRRQQRQLMTPQRTTTTTTTTTTALRVFERMTEDCVAALVTAQQQSARLQTEHVDPPVLLAGCVDHPETAALQRTLQQYRITWRRVETALSRLYSNNDNDNKGWLSGFRAAAANEDRPFSRSTKQTLMLAGQLADQMGSTAVGTHHVFLALFEYREKQGGANKNNTATESNEVWELLQKMQILEDNTTALDICQSLIANLQETSSAAATDSRELVTGGAGSTSKTMPTLNDVGTDLTQQATDGLLDPVFGRDKEIRSCIRTLIRRRKNNVCLIGDAGVGKTAIAEGIAQVLASSDQKCPVPLRGHRLVSVELSSLVAGTKYRGEFEERLQSIIKEVTDPKAPPTILFLDEIHNLVGAGAAEGGMDAANLLKPALARGEMQVIGATTIAEYRKYIEKDAALERRLQPVFVKEPTVPQTIEILHAVQGHYERHHNVKYQPEAIRAAAALSERYLNDRFLPDKALDLLDEAGATAQLEYHENDNNNNNNNNSDEIPVVTEHTVAEVISEWTGIPIGKLENSEMDRLRALEVTMGNRVKGQGRAIRGVARAIRRARSGLRDPKRPVASFLFCGPTGTGKTELCKTLAETYYGSEKDMIRIDMSEFMEKHSVSRLTGPPPGYIGYEEGGVLTEAVRRSPHSVVLLDEIDKAHEDVLNILLQIMEDGILTDGKGRTVNFKNTVLVMTSNIGSRRILEVCRSAGAQAESAAKVADTIQAINGAAASSSSSVSKLDAKPMEPEDVLKRMQNNPAAASLLMKASSDPEIMGAIRTAMSGSPADLRAAAQKNPVISQFLQDVWGALSDEDGTSIRNSSSDTTNKSSSGLDAIRSSFQDTLSQWDDKGTGDFASGVWQQLNGSAAAQQQQDHALYPQLIEVVKEELESAMKPELLNRIDEIVVFSPLSRVDLASIARLNIEKIVARASEQHNLEFKVLPDLVERVLAEGSAVADTFGARPMRRAAQRLVEDVLSDAILQGFLTTGDSATLSLATDGTNRVAVTSAANGETLMVDIEDASGGIGSIPATKPPISLSSSSTNGSAQLETEPAQ